MRTSATGARVVLNADGLYAYNSSGGQTVGINAQTGAVSLTANVTQTNSYGSARFGPQIYAGDDVTPGVGFRVPGYDWWGPGGIYATDDGSAGFPVMRLQGFVDGPLDGSSISLAPGGTSTDAPSFFRRTYTNGALSRLQFGADKNAYLDTGGGNVSVRSRNTPGTSNNAYVTFQNDGNAFMRGKASVYITSDSTDGSVRLQKQEHIRVLGRGLCPG